MSSSPATPTGPLIRGGFESVQASVNSDIDFFGISEFERDESGRRAKFQFRVTSPLSRLDGQLYGGTAIGVSIVGAEAVSGLQALWMTTQFVATAPGGSVISTDVEVLAGGRRTAQVRVTGSDEHGAIMFASLGAAGSPSSAGLDGRYETAPTVSDPQDSEPISSPFESLAASHGVDLAAFGLPRHTGFVTTVDYRLPEVVAHPDPGPGRICVWVRRRDHSSITAALAAFIADMVPMSVATAGGMLGGGISLDNTIRLGSFPPNEWVLIDLRPHMAVGGYGHGAAHVWGEDRRLLATASQSATMLAFGPPDT